MRFPIRLLGDKSAFWLLLGAFALLLMFLLIFRRLRSLKTQRETEEESAEFLKADAALSLPARLFKIEPAPKRAAYAAKATFLPENGEPRSFELSAAQYAVLPAEGSFGLLRLEGDRFLRFDVTQSSPEKENQYER